MFGPWTNKRVRYASTFARSCACICSCRVYFAASVRAIMILLHGSMSDCSNVSTHFEYTCWRHHMLSPKVHAVPKVCIKHAIESRGAWFDTRIHAYNVCAFGMISRSVWVCFLSEYIFSRRSHRNPLPPYITLSSLVSEYISYERSAIAFFSRVAPKKVVTNKCFGMWLAKDSSSSGMLIKMYMVLWTCLGNVMSEHRVLGAHLKMFDFARAPHVL